MKRRNLLISICISSLLFGCGYKLDSSINSSSESSFSEESLSSEEVIKERNKRVVLIGVDGAGHNFNENNTPFINSIMSSGASTHEALTSNPTISAQSWGSLFTGLSPDVHKFDNGSITKERNTSFPTFFKSVHEQDEDALLASFCNWSPINYGIIEDDIGVHKENPGEDETVTNRVIDYLSNNDPKVTFIHFDGVDHAGHSIGYNTSQYYEAIKVIDKLVERIYNTLVSLNRIEDTLFMITSDHGGNGTNHGGLSYEERYVYFGAVGKGVNNITINNMYIRDVKSIVLEGLGLTDYDEDDSYVPKDMFQALDNNSRRINPINEEVYPSLDKLANYLDSSNVSLYQTFDNDINDITNNNKVSSRGDISFSSGVLNQGLSLNKDSSLTINNNHLFNNDFSISLFVKIDSFSGDPCIFSTSNWDNGYNDGMNLALANDYMIFNVGGNEKRCDIDVQYPTMNKEYFHILISYNSLTCEVSFYLDFAYEFKLEINNELLFNSSLPFVINNDGTDNYIGGTSEIDVDELIVFSSSLSSKNVQSLKEYYIDINK